MKRKIKVNDSLSVIENIKRKRTITSIIDDKKRMILTNIKTNESFWSKVIFDENYVIVYSRGCTANQIPLNIEAAYNIKEKQKLDLSNKKLKVLLEYIFITAKDFKLTDILTFINSEDLKIVSLEEKIKLKQILTSGNNNITDAEVIEYIISKYPVLANYRNLKGPLTNIDYKNIKEEIGQEIFRFHLMIKNLKFLEQINLEETNENNRNYGQIYVSEYEHQQRILKKDKN